MQSLLHQYHWDRGWWHCDFSELTSDFKLLRSIQKETCGAADLRWLPVARIAGHELLIDGTGSGIPLRAINKLARRGSTLEEVVSWRWNSDGNVAFHCEALEYPLEAAAADQFRWLCDVLIANYPALASRPVDLASLSAYSPTEQDWSICAHGSAVALSMEHYPRDPLELGDCRTMRKAETLAARHSKPKVKKLALRAHPELSTLEQLWAEN